MGLDFQHQSLPASLHQEPIPLNIEVQLVIVHHHKQIPWKNFNKRHQKGRKFRKQQKKIQKKLRRLQQTAANAIKFQKLEAVIGKKGQGQAPLNFQKKN
jgi:hypothetical protein